MVHTSKCVCSSNCIDFSRHQIPADSLTLQEVKLAALRGLPAPTRQDQVSEEPWASVVTASRQISPSPFPSIDCPRRKLPGDGVKKTKGDDGVEKSTVFCTQSTTTQQKADHLDNGVERAGYESGAATS